MIYVHNSSTNSNLVTGKLRCVWFG